MKTVTTRIVFHYLKSYGVTWTFGFLFKYLARAGTIQFQVPGYGKLCFHARKGTSDVRVFNQVILRRSYQLPFLLPNVGLIVDAGANSGYSARYFATTYPAAKIFAIEPDESNFNLLQINSHSLPNITPFLGALWPTRTRLAIQNPNAPKTAIRVGNSGPSSGLVETVTIPELVRQYGVIDILKIDIEGAEIEVFSSDDLTWLRNVRCLIIELHDFMRAGCSPPFYRAISKHDFSQFISGENLIVLFHRYSGE